MLSGQPQEPLDSRGVGGVDMEDPGVEAVRDVGCVNLSRMGTGGRDIGTAVFCPVAQQDAIDRLDRGGLAAQCRQHVRSDFQPRTERRQEPANEGREQERAVVGHLQDVEAFAGTDDFPPVALIETGVGQEHGRLGIDDDGRRASAGAHGPAQQEIGQEGRSPRGRQVDRVQACSLLDHTGHEGVLDQAVPQAKEIAAGRPGLGGPGTVAPAQAHRVGEIEPVARHEALDRHDQADRSGESPRDRDIVRAGRGDEIGAANFDVGTVQRRQLSDRLLR